jgi:ribosomal protein S18 acetylase RimI-like enzyme
MRLRAGSRSDTERILSIVLATGRFDRSEVDWAMEYVRLAHEKPDEYRLFVAEEESQADGCAVLGYVCYGPAPKTEDVWDLYWIAVDPRSQGQGIGTLLLHFVENDVQQKRGRMLLIETSSKTSDDATVQFYLSHGYEEISRIKDFYRTEDDKIIFRKNLRQS